MTAAGDTPTIGFTGHVNDADTGLVYMQQRYYDPVAGRFLSIDPVDIASGGSFNRFGYASQSPYSYIDPDGSEDEPVPVIIITGERPKPPPPPSPSPPSLIEPVRSFDSIVGNLPTLPQSFVSCLDERKWDWGSLGPAGATGSSIAGNIGTGAKLANAAANVAAGPTGSGIGSASHATSWQHRVASNLGQAEQIAQSGMRTGAVQARYSAVGKLTGRIALLPTI